MLPARLAPPRRLPWSPHAALLLAALLPACSAHPGAPAPAEAAPATSPEARAEALLRQMTLAEKIAYVGGDRSFYIRAVPRLGIPEIKMADGPAGCRNWGPSTAYPAPIGVAAAFDGALAERVGRALGRDCRARGVHVLLAPGVDIQRSPKNGRNFEYLGEDPFLAGKTAAAFVRGVQGEGVIATVKHFAANDQEWDRNHVSAEVDERTLREIHLPAFERAVREGHAGAVMTAYNLLDGTYCTHDAWLIKGVLERDWGFAGFVMSDWKAAHDPLATANGGCDLEMPSGEQMNERTLLPAIAEGKVRVETIDDKVRRILRTIVAAGFLDRKQAREDVPRDDPEGVETALAAAREGLVLLQNRGGLLPLDRAKLKRIAVIGPNAHPAVWGGSGSAFVTPFHTVSVLDGVRRAAPGVEVVHHPGVRRPADAAPDLPLTGGADVDALAASADVVIVAVGFGQSAETGSAGAAFKPFWPPPWARKAGLVEAEDSDRPFALPAAQVETVRRAAAANPRTIVVVNSGGGVDLAPFVDRVPALIWASYPGQEGGRAIAEAIFGDVNPSGKLPVTFARRYEDYPSAPFYDVNEGGKTPYGEGVFVGYRGFDARGVEPAFPFGHGLGYTTFAYADLAVEAAGDGTATVALTVRNNGGRAGDEVVEVYVAPPPGRVPRPPQALAGFARVALAPGESRRVSIALEARAFAIWDTQAGGWVVPGGAYEVRVGASSRDVRLRGRVEVAGRKLAI